LLSLGTYAYWWMMDASKAVQSFAAVLIVFCPCTLALSIPFCYSNVMRILGKHKFYLKSPEVVESLAKTDTIVFDKTGTLTSTEQAIAEYSGKNLTAEEFDYIKSLTLHSTHPLSKIIFNSLTAEKIHRVKDFKETTSKGIEGKINNTYIKIGSSSFVNDTLVKKEERTKVYISINSTTPGYFIIKNKIRKGLPELIKNLYKKFELHLLSGDHSGQRTEMQDLFKDSSRVHFEKDPMGKLDYIKKLKSENKTVLMIGDGLNDAGALKKSDTGITISDNVYNFSPACDAILDSDNLKRLDIFIDFCQKSHLLVKASLIISLIYNITGLFFAMSGNLNPLIAAILMPASSVSVVLFVIIGSNILALKKGLTRLSGTYKKIDIHQ
ncbi:MAG: HAD-IC family P-type ATPase, partial [Cytophagaceae bacterium]|nr:HAD-IC family P-type ATPase [Cytophagaceae bacterium]